MMDVPRTVVENGFPIVGVVKRILGCVKFGQLLLYELTTFFSAVLGDPEQRKGED